MRCSILLLALCSCVNERASWGKECGEFAIPDEPTLSCTGIRAKDVIAFKPANELWSDGLTKRRFIRIPAGKQIDTSDPNEWVFPVGTQIWKEFSWEGRPIETRYLLKWDEDSWWRSTYQWSDDGRTTTLVLETRRGPSDVANGTYEIPGQKTCDGCHEGRRDTVLGLDAINVSMPGAEGLTAQTLKEKKLITKPLPEFFIEGDELDQRVAGYLHVNCGVSCHVPGKPIETVNGEMLEMDLRLDALRAGTPPFLEQTVNVIGFFPASGPIPRIDPGKPDNSAIYVRMSSLKLFEHMPTLGSRVLHRDAINDVKAYIERLPH